MELSCTRRELIAAFLGAPLAAAACREPAAARFECTLGGQDHSLGHRLRDGLRLVPARTREVPVVIVGGGIAGLSAAWRLERANQLDYELLELEAEPGGSSRSARNSVAAYPWGAHYLPCPLPHARAVRRLLLEMNIARARPDGTLDYDEAQLVRAPHERLFMVDRWYEGLYPHAGASRDDLAQLKRFELEVERLARWRDASQRRAFAVPSAAATDSDEILALDRGTLGEWLRAHGFSSPRLRWWLEYGTRDDYGATVEQTSAYAGLHYHAARASEQGGSELLTWPEGNGRLVEHLAQVAGSRLRGGVALAKLRAQAAGGYELLTIDARTGACEALLTRHVVLAIPPAIAAGLLDPAPEPLLACARGMQTGAWLVVNLTLRRRPASRGYSECWDNVIHGSRSLGYVVATHQTDSPDRARTVWTWYLPLTGDDPAHDRGQLLGLSAAECAELAIADLTRAHPDLPQCIERADAFRWGHAMPRPLPGLFSGPLARARRELAQPFGGLHFAHSDLAAMSLFEEAQWHGVRAAEQVLSARGHVSASYL
jgi:protoporphyrinogen oxidase